MPTHIYVGPWVNWSHGLIVGATLTFSTRGGGFLISFIATFVTLVSVELWKLLCFAFHQIRSTGAFRDGLHYQQQVIFRNSATPGSTAWTFAQQWWYWRHRARRSAWRTLPWALLAVIYLALFACAAIFSSDISKAPGSARLIIGETCGFWKAGEQINDTSSLAYRGKVSNVTLVGAAYARACYGGSHDSLNCDRLPVRQLAWAADRNASCPFASGMCVYGDTAAYRMTTKLIDSHTDLGINAPSHNRIQLQHSTTCAPLRTAGYTRIVPGTGGIINDTLSQLLYGPQPGNDFDFTYSYNTHTNNVLTSYKVDTIMSYATAAVPAWQPIDALNRTDGDVSLVLIAGNSVLFPEKCYDPVFSATMKNVSDRGTGIAWVTDYNYVPIGCVDQYRICNPTNQQCSPYLGVLQVMPWIMEHATTTLDLNLVQQGATVRIMDALNNVAIHFQVVGRGVAALRATETLYLSFQMPLPPDQWMIEVGSWFETGLAQIQQRVLQYATGPDNVAPGSSIWSPAQDGNLILAAMCQNQMINDAQDTISFSVLGMAILFTIGILIWVTNQFKEAIATRLNRKIKWIRPKLESWKLDDSLQMQRTMLEEKGLAKWNDTAIPTTMHRKLFVGTGGKATSDGQKYSVISSELPVESSCGSDIISEEPRDGRGSQYHSPTAN